MLGISGAFVRRLIAAGELQHVTIGRRVLVPLESVHAYADKLTAA
jgi:excisionase family DNA binding protein